MLYNYMQFRKRVFIMYAFQLRKTSNKDATTYHREAALFTPQHITGKLHYLQGFVEGFAQGFAQSILYMAQSILHLVHLTFCTLRSPSVETKLLSMGYFR